jgi:hypothetical protein
MEEVESHSHLPSITSQAFYLLKVEAVCLAVFRDYKRSTAITGWVGYGTFPETFIVKPSFHFTLSAFQGYPYGPRGIWSSNPGGLTVPNNDQPITSENPKRINGIRALFQERPYR